MSVNRIPTLINPPNAPKKEMPTKPYRLHRIRALMFPVSPGLAPPPPPRKEKTRKQYNLTPIPIKWDRGSFDVEAKFLARSGFVREKFLLYTPDDVTEEINVKWLTRLRELYFPSGQPRNVYEDAYVNLMRDAIEIRLQELSSISL